MKTVLNMFSVSWVKYMTPYGLTFPNGIATCRHSHSLINSSFDIILHSFYVMLRLPKWTNPATFSISSFLLTICFSMTVLPNNSVCVFAMLISRLVSSPAWSSRHTLSRNASQLSSIKLISLANLRLLIRSSQMITQFYCFESHSSRIRDRL